jgi:hypothetical protein
LTSNPTNMTNKIKRRSFLETSVKGIAATGLLATVPPAFARVNNLEKLFIHHVYFWLKKPVTPEVRAKFEKALKELVTIETVVDFHLGVPAPKSRDVVDASYSYSLLITFKNKEDQDIYQPHPKHQKFISDCQDLWEKVVVYDSVSI